MSTLTESATTALELTLSSDPVLWTIVGRSLSVSATACVMACGVGLVLGAWLGVARFAGRGAVLAQVPRHSFSLWNKYDVNDRIGAGIGVIYRDDVFAAADNLVTLPAFTRVDGGLFWTVTRQIRAQVNVENLFDTGYYVSAHNNSNIQPGSPRAIRVAMTTRF